MLNLKAGLCKWTDTASRKLAHLSKADAVVLALYGFGMVVTQSSGLTTIAVFLGYLPGKQANSVRQQLREFN